MAFLENYDSHAEIGGETFKFGFDNFKSIVTFYRFKDALLTTVLLTVLTVPISTMLALLIAVALNSIKFVRRTLQNDILSALRYKHHSDWYGICGNVQDYRRRFGA